MQIIESNYFSFERYKTLVEKYEKVDWREINFQNRVVLALLEKIFINDANIYIVDVASQYENRESKIHTREFYAGDYTPDLLIVKNWNYANRNISKKDYLAVVEIKSPVLDPISKENIHTKAEVDDYIRNGQKVILTDCYKWVFYGFEEEPVEFTLRDINGWIMIYEENPEVLIEELGIQENRKESKDWDALINYIESIFV